MAMPPANWLPSRGATALATHRRSPSSANQVWEPMPPLCAVTWTPVRPQQRIKHETSSGSVITSRVNQSIDRLAGQAAGLLVGYRLVPVVASEGLMEVAAW